MTSKTNLPKEGDEALSSSIGAAANNSPRMSERRTATRQGALRPGRWPHEAALVGLLAVSLVASSMAWADSFRCGRKLVRSGDSQSRLLSACGQPQFRDSGQEALWSGGSQKKVRVQRWYYKSSGRKLGRVVLLHQGRVVAVQTEGR